MVAGKVKAAMGLQKSQPNPKPEPSPKPSSSPSPSSDKVPQKGAAFSRSFGVYFPRSSVQVQPRPPDVAELLHLVEELRERESRLKTELLEQKLLKESVAILPILENDISKKDCEIERSNKKIVGLEAENESLRQEVEMMHSKLLEQRRENDDKFKVMEAEISALKKAQIEKECEEISTSQRYHGLIDASCKSGLMKNLKKNGTFLENYNYNRNDVEQQKAKEKVVEAEPRHSSANSSEEITELVVTARSRVPRVPKPPPRPSLSFSSASSHFSVAPLSPSSSSSSSSSLDCSAERAMAEPSPVPPPPPPPPPLLKLAPKVATKAAPPPPPPPPKGLKNGAAKVRRVPEVVEFYHSLMRRDSRRDSSTGGGTDVAATANARDMIGEIENRSTHLLAIKTDVETQGDFIRFLIKEVENAAFTDIQDAVPFVKWLDDELSYLVDERAVLKHFQWPEQKADTLREAAFGFCDLKKLESEASSFRDDPRQPCAPALKKMQALFEKLEHGVYNLSRMRESAAKRYKGFQIPVDWMLDTGYVSQIKLASVKLAMKYMKRVSAELETVGGGPDEEELIVHGVKFAFRAHQFAGGFDVETMRAFQELRDKARSCHIQCQNQQQQKYVCRSTAC